MHTLGYLQISCCHISGFDLRKFALCLLWFMQFFYYTVVRVKAHRQRQKHLQSTPTSFSAHSVCPYIGQNFLRARSKVKRTFHFLIKIQICGFNYFLIVLIII